ncbi:MAG: hypothetical protein ACF8R7_11190 [Phycisphaerales bacterium JB039]
MPAHWELAFLVVLAGAAIVRLFRRKRLRQAPVRIAAASVLAELRHSSRRSTTVAAVVFWLMLLVFLAQASRPFWDAEIASEITSGRQWLAHWLACVAFLAMVFAVWYYVTELALRRNAAARGRATASARP